ncbi:uncharacterized protein [Misgurnus anguillicaudatus]|uniref:uncharacterized protein isoform X1 n=1 Tax=Misgurnus anguillicaudatus TaxID=75329 RepID=UPI003CCF7D82
MLKLFMLATVVLYCNGCFSPDIEVTDEGCPDEDGNIHEFDSYWEDGTFTCVCMTTGSFCCESTPEDKINFEQDDESFDDSELFEEDSDDNSNEDGENSNEYDIAAAAAVAAALGGGTEDK